MKAEFELSLDSKGRPCIVFRHYDKDKSLDQKVLGEYISALKDHGCVLANTSGCISTNGDSWENYEIQIKRSD